jgi:hypothetical protein
LPYKLWAIWYATKGINAKFGERLLRRQKLKLINPSIVEKAFGWLNLCVLAVTVWLKYEAETMIFMLNPCHVITVRITEVDVLGSASCLLPVAIQLDDRVSRYLLHLAELRRILGDFVSREQRSWDSRGDCVLY